MNKLLFLTNPFKQATRSVSIGVRGDLTACKPKPDYGPNEVMRSEFMNGMKIACGKILGTPLVASTILFQAGSRFETDNELGVTHFLRAASICSGLGVTSFMKGRFLQQMGGQITVSTNRQTVAFTMRCPFYLFEELKGYLVDGCVRCQFPEHELDAVRKMVREDLTRRPQAQHVIDLVQKACFGGPLSNSIYCEPNRINTINSDILNNYASNFFKTSSCSLGSHGISFEEMLTVAAQIDCGNVERPPDFCAMPSFPRGGYEVYDKGPGGLTYIALAVPGAPACDLSTCVRLSILAATCGQTNIHSGSYTGNRLPPTPLGCLTNDIFTDYKAFNISYSDCGCWGILIKTRSKNAYDAAFRATEFFNNLGAVSPAQIEVGKARLKLGVLINDDSSERSSENLAVTMANNVNIDNSEQLCACIDCVPANDVIAVAQNLVSKRAAGQMAVAVVGDVAATPNDVELMCY